MSQTRKLAYANTVSWKSKRKNDGSFCGVRIVKQTCNYEKRVAITYFILLWQKRKM